MSEAVITGTMQNDGQITGMVAGEQMLTGEASAASELTGHMAVAQPVIAPLEVTENGTYTASGGVSGYSPVTVDVVASGGVEDLFVSVSERTLTTVTHPSVKSIGAYLFHSYTSLKSVDFPNAKSLGAYAFNGCTGITAFSAPKVTSIGTYGFYNVAALTKIYFPEMLSVGTYAFRQCRKITRAYFPKATSVGTYALSRCNVLSVVDLGQVSTIAGSVFAEDYAIKTLILRKSDGIVTLSATSAFTSTPFATNGSGGTVYCPSALIEAYQTAANWSTLFAAGTCTFVPLEGSIYEDEGWGQES